MKNMYLMAAIVAVVAPSVPLLAQPNQAREQRRDVREADREYREDLRDADNPREVRRAQREHARSIANAASNWPSLGSTMRSVKEPFPQPTSSATAPPRPGSTPPRSKCPLRTSMNQSCGRPRNESNP